MDVPPAPLPPTGGIVAAQFNNAVSQPSQSILKKETCLSYGQDFYQRRLLSAPIAHLPTYMCRDTHP